MAEGWKQFEWKRTSRTYYTERVQFNVDDDRGRAIRCEIQWRDDDDPPDARDWAVNVGTLGIGGVTHSMANAKCRAITGAALLWMAITLEEGERPPFPADLFWAVVTEAPELAAFLQRVGFVEPEDLDGRPHDA